MFKSILRILSNILKRQYFGVINSILQRDSRVYFSCVITHKLPRGVRLVHPVGVVIGRDIDFGENVRILQNVTIGTIGLGKSAGPKIGNNVVIGAGAVVVGDIVIGNDVVIGANSVVTSDVPDNYIVKQSKSIMEGINK